MGHRKIYCLQKGIAIKSKLKKSSNKQTLKEDMELNPFKPLKQTLKNVFKKRLVNTVNFQTEEPKYN